MHCVGIGNCGENPQDRTLVFTYQKFISLKIAVHILPAVKGVFSKDLGPMLEYYSILKIRINSTCTNVANIDEFHG